MTMECLWLQNRVLMVGVAFSLFATTECQMPKKTLDRYIVCNRVFCWAATLGCWNLQDYSSVE